MHHNTIDNIHIFSNGNEGHLSSLFNIALFSYLIFVNRCCISCM